MFQRFIALFLLIILSPFFLIFYILVKLDSPGSFIFKQKRMGKNRKSFWIYKIRTMVENAERLKFNVQRFNEADGPVFKIENDPRHTKFGRLLSRTGLDELPQLVNIIKGEMAFVGPRPLPINEAKKVPKQYQRRFSVLPGITSSWVVEGSHKLSFKEWMELDLQDIKNKTIRYDFSIAAKTVWLIVRSLIK